MLSFCYRLNPYQMSAKDKLHATVASYLQYFIQYAVQTLSIYRPMSCHSYSAVFRESLKSAKLIGTISLIRHLCMLKILFLEHFSKYTYFSRTYFHNDRQIHEKQNSFRIFLWKNGTSSLPWTVKCSYRYSIGTLRHASILKCYDIEKESQHFRLLPSIVSLTSINALTELLIHDSLSSIFNARIKNILSKRWILCAFKGLFKEPPRC